MSEDFIRGPVVHKGKTKKVYSVVDHDGFVICENCNDITADDDPKKTRQFATKAEYATTTTCQIFELLKSCGIKTTFVKQLSPNSFLANKSKMVELEVVGRRLGVGSFLKRKPQFITEDSTNPYRFHRIEFELFLKTSGANWQGQPLPCDDPWIVDPYTETWQLAAPKAPLWDKEAQTGFFTIDRDKFLYSSIFTKYQPSTNAISRVEELLRKVFLILECAWANLGHRLVDIKIEIDEHLRVSDVIDNDSWRLWAPDGEQLDKQVFRDYGDEKIKEIEEKYGRVARLSERLRLPKQVLVFWKASPDDEDFKDWPQTVHGKKFPGVDVIEVSGSAHKNSVMALRTIESIFRNYPEGGVIVTKVGRSNGIGATFAAHSSWPVITLPDTYKDFPDDVHSSVHCPSEAPSMVCWPESNALLAALKILGNKNPAVYAEVQLMLEKLDNYISS